MKIFVTLMLSPSKVYNNIISRGFTNKAEAKDEKENGLREGNRIDYFDANFKNVVVSNAS